MSPPVGGGCPRGSRRGVPEGGPGGGPGGPRGGPGGTPGAPGGPRPGDVRRRAQVKLAHQHLSRLGELLNTLKNVHPGGPGGPPGGPGGSRDPPSGGVPGDPRLGPPSGSDGTILGARYARRDGSLRAPPASTFRSATPPRGYNQPPVPALSSALQFGVSSLRCGPPPSAQVTSRCRSGANCQCRGPGMAVSCIRRWARRAVARRRRGYPWALLVASRWVSLGPSGTLRVSVSSPPSTPSPEPTGWLSGAPRP